MEVKIEDENIITKEQALAGEDNELILYMAQNNSEEFNLNKALEEATEFMEVAIKLKTKSKKNPKRPKREDALEEFVDFILRGSIYIKSLFPDKNQGEVTEMMEKHVEKKMDALKGWLKSGKYENGL